MNRQAIETVSMHRPIEVEDSQDIPFSEHPDPFNHPSLKENTAARWIDYVIKRDDLFNINMEGRKEKLEDISNNMSQINSMVSYLRAELKKNEGKKTIVIKQLEIQLTKFRETWDQLQETLPENAKMAYPFNQYDWAEPASVDMINDFKVRLEDLRNHEQNKIQPLLLSMETAIALHKLLCEITKNGTEYNRSSMKGMMDRVR